MKSKLILLLVMVLPVAARAADALNPELQRGLFEEEANQNFAAAIKAYQTVLTTHDSERKLAATALFRLGECYRKLGHTNDAIAQYRRLVAEFADQTVLANLSRQNLNGLGVLNANDPRRGSSSERVRALEATLAAVQTQAAEIESSLNPLQTASRTQRRSLFPTFAPDSLLNRLLEELSAAQRKAVTLETSFARDHPDVRAARTVVVILEQQVDERIDGIVYGLKTKSEVLNNQAESIKKQLAELTKAASTAADGGPAVRPTDPAARTQLKELLGNEVKIAEQFASEQRKRVETGTLAKGEEVRFERDVLGLKRQLVAVDGLSSAEDRQRWRELLMEEIRLAEEALSLEKRKLENGKSIASEVARLQRDVLILKRELVAFDALPPATPMTAGEISPAPSPEAEELALSERLLAQLQGWDLSQLRKLIPTLAPDADMERLEKDLAANQDELRTAEANRNAVDYQNRSEVLIQNRDQLRQRIADRAAQIVAQLEKRIANLRERVAKQQPRFTGSFRQSPPAESTAPTDEEEKEIRRIQALIKDSPDLINAGGERGRTPLHQAAIKGQLVVAGFLLANKANVNARQTDGLTPLHEAVRNGHKSMTELLLKSGADVNAGPSVEGTPLHSAASRGFKAIVEVLLAYKADVNAVNDDNSTPLHGAVSKGYKNVAETLVDAGANINLLNRFRNLRGPMESYSHDSGTPLHIAVWNRNEAIVDLLLAHGAEVNLRNQFGETPMHFVGNSPELASRLIAAHADVNARIQRDGNTRGKTPLCVAVLNNSAETVALLIKNGADPNVRFSDSNDSRSENILLIAATDRPDSSDRVVEELLVNGADPNSTAGNGYAPIHVAVLRSKESVVKLLLEHGASVNVRTGEGDTPLALAVKGEMQDLAMLLLKHGGDPNIGNNTGTTPLHFAVGKQNEELLELLLSAGANVNATDSQGLSALDYVKMGNRAQVPGAVVGLRGPSGVGLLAPKNPAAPKKDLAERLRQAGARDWAPRPGLITITRRESGNTFAVFSKGTNEWNRYSFFEAMAFTYFGSASVFPFPDFSKITITRLDPVSGKITELKVDLPAKLTADACKGDFWLEWGDLISIPEVEHTLDEKWSGLPSLDFAAIAKCLERTVTIRVKGTEKEVRFAGLIQWKSQSGRFGRLEYYPEKSYRLDETLQRSGLLLTSSDTSHVKVTRTSSTQPGKNERVFDLTRVSKDDDLWLRDGDVIEVPEK